MPRKWWVGYQKLFDFLRHKLRKVLQKHPYHVVRYYLLCGRDLGFLIGYTFSFSCRPGDYSAHSVEEGLCCIFSLCQWCHNIAESYLRYLLLSIKSEANTKSSIIYKVAQVFYFFSCPLIFLWPPYNIPNPGFHQAEPSDDYFCLDAR